MELLPRTHPRFCAKYFGFVGFAETPRKSAYQKMTAGGRVFEFMHYQASDLAPGDVVYIAKRIATHHGQPVRWAIHKIALPEEYWAYEYWARRTPKERRTVPYSARAQTWFGSGTYLVRALT